MQWSERRKDYRYDGFVFSGDGAVAREGGIEYRERPFPARAQRQFRVWLAASLLLVFPGIPLMAAAGILHERLFLLAGLACALLYWQHGRIHRCPGCGGKSRVLSTPHMDAPVLYLCRSCRSFFEHGTIEGGWPCK